jgi:hypothetical protein
MGAGVAIHSQKARTRAPFLYMARSGCLGRDIPYDHCQGAPHSHLHNGVAKSNGGPRLQGQASISLISKKTFMGMPTTMSFNGIRSSHTLVVLTQQMDD